MAPLRSRPIGGPPGRGEGVFSVRGRLTGIQDAEARHTEVLTTGSAEVNVGASVVVDAALGKHGVVLELRLAKRWAVARDNDQLGLARRRVLSVDLYPREYLPLLITSWRRELMDSCAFFAFFLDTILLVAPHVLCVDPAA